MIIGGTVIGRVLPSGGIGNRLNIQEIASRNQNQNIDCVNAAARLLIELRGEGYNASILVGKVNTITRVWVIVEENPGRCGVAIEPNSGTVVPLTCIPGVPKYTGMSYDTTSDINTSSCEVR